MSRDSLWAGGADPVAVPVVEPAAAAVSVPPLPVAPAPVMPSGSATSPMPSMAPPRVRRGARDHTPASGARVGRRAARPRPLIVDLLAALAGLGLGITIALGVSAESAGSLSAAGGWLTAAGRMAGLVAAYAMVVVVVLVARFPPLERAVGQDRLVHWHRKLGPWPLYLLVAHAVLITLGYAQAAHDGVLHQLWTLIWTYPGILASVVGFVLLMAAGVSSYKRARRRMAYETWWSVHLYLYLALFLSFSHQVDTGASFVGHETTRFWWTALWIGTLVLVIACRVGLPVWRSLRHRLVVDSVIDEGRGTYSVLLRGRALDRLPVSGGQFFQWRFMRRGAWWQAHPYSLSAVPGPDHLRITVKDLGDHSRSLARLRPGTRVAIEGPYGAFTPEHRHGDRVLLIGAGVGTTPIRALLDELPEHADVITILRASTTADIVLRDEIVAAVQQRRGVLHEVVGSRETVSFGEAALRRAVPDIAERDVFLCGPEPLTERIVEALRRAGVPRSHIHFESFAF